MKTTIELAREAGVIATFKTLHPSIEILVALVRADEREAKRDWVGLTDDEVSTLIGNEIGFNSCCGWETEYTRAVEAKLRERNT
jgi:hypothetical protein